MLEGEFGLIKGSNVVSDKSDDNLQVCIAYFNNLADDDDTLPPSALRREVDALWDGLDLEPGKRVLELGSGFGRHLGGLVARGVDGVGVELAPKLVERSRRVYGLNILQADARSFRTPPDEPLFDSCFILPGGILGASTMEDDLAVLRAATQSVRPGGRIFVAAPHVAFHLKSESFSPLFCRHLVTQQRADGLMKYWQRSYHRAELANLLARSQATPLPPRLGPLGESQTQPTHTSVTVVAERQADNSVTEQTQERDTPQRGMAAWYKTFFEGMGAEYLDYSFTKGTDYEVHMLIERLELQGGERLLDVGCGVGRHALELGRRGFRVHGIDLSPSMIEVARQRAAEQGINASFEVMDARELPATGDFDAAWSVCQGAFSLLSGDEANLQVLRAVRRALRPGARFFLTAQNLLRMLKYDVPVDLDYAVEYWMEAPASKPEGKALECSNRAYLFPELVAFLEEAGFEAEVPTSNFYFGKSIVSVGDYELSILTRAS